MNFKVISGGQTGVDQAGLRAAKALGIPTGGYAPKGWVTEMGPAPWLADFGLVECEEKGYPARTKWNVAMAEAIIVIETNWFPHWSKGTNLVIDLTQRDLGNGGARSEPPRQIVEWTAISLGRPCPLAKAGRGFWGLEDLRKTGCGFRPRHEYMTPKWIADTVLRHGRPKTLMIAGNRESRNPGLGVAAEEFLTEVFQILMEVS